MANPGLPETVLRETYQVFLECDENQSEAARRLGISRHTLRNRIDRYKELGPVVEADPLPASDLEGEELFEFLCRRYKKRESLERAKKWRRIKINKEGPIGICWFGDPHVDDNGCNLPLLKSHVEICRETDGMFGANIGDTTNNWVGRLMKKYADQDTSQATARKLAKWFLCESGIDWVLWILGNHDMWNDGAEVLRLMNVNDVPMEEWQAKIKLVFPNGREAKIDARHNFPGHSQWNTMHGPQKAAHMKEPADLYICGHTHNWALHQEESASKEFTYWLARARGYKFIDEYAEKLGHDSQQRGASIVSIFDPEASEFLHCFSDVAEAADYLRFKRG